MSGDDVLAAVTTELFMPLYELAIGISAVYFLYGVAKYVFDLNNPEKQTYGRSHMLYGTIGLFIVLSVGGILGIFGDIFGGLSR